VAKKLRLLHVIVQPVFVIEDGDAPLETMTVDPPVIVSPADWPTFATTGYTQATERLQATFDAETPPAPNRASRRTAAKKPSARKAKP
jgi:hypothetical protein